MKGQSKRFVDHLGKAYDTTSRNTKEHIGFFDLWRYATWGECMATVTGVVLAWVASAGLIAAVVIYGEITSLFVQRHRAAPTTPHHHILTLFGGGTQLPEGNRSLHMDALVSDACAFGLASLAIMFVQFAAAATAVTIVNTAAARMITRLRWQLLRSVISQEIAFFDTNTTMNFASSLTEDVEKLRAGVGEHVAMTSYLGGSVVLGSALALSYGWQLTLAGLAVVPVAIAVAATVAKYQTRCSSREVTAYGAAALIVEEVLSAIRTVRAYGGEEHEVERYLAALSPAGALGRRRALWAAAGAGLGWLLTYALNAVVFAYGAALCVRDLALPPDQQQYHPGIMLTILFCTFMSAQNIAMCHPHLEIFSAARGAAKSLFRLLERRSAIDALQDCGVKPDHFRGDIVFDNLYFNYPSRPDVKVLRGLTLKVNAGETVALVGGSGCGKSTVLQLLQRLYEPDSGNITVDGQPLTALNLHHFRTSIGVVGQEPVLFSGTIRDNITLGVDDVSEEEVVAAAKIAHAHHFITKLANGYDTMLESGGAQLSGGQKQRVAIARAVLRRPAVLLLDEPTSALDPTAERQVQAALDAASQGRTTIVVSHRLSTIVNASRIVFMEQGCVREQGSHSQLLAARGAYWTLVQDDMSNKNVSPMVPEEEGTEAAAEAEGAAPAVREEGAAPAAREEGAAPAAREEGAAPAAREEGAQLPRGGRRRSSILSRNSLSRGSFIRSSCRLGSVSHISSPAHDLLQHVEPVEEGPEEEPPAATWALLRLNAREWPQLAGGALASLAVGASMPVFALLLSKLYGMFSMADGSEILSQSRLYAGLFLVVAAACGLVMFLQSFLFSRAGAALTDRLRVAVFTNYLRQEQAWFDSPANSVGALCARLATDCAAVQGATGSRLGTVLQGASTMVIGVSLALAYSWKMTLVSLLSVPCVIGGIYLEGYITRRTEARERRALEDASRAATEAVLNIRTVHSLGVERALLSRYRSSLQAAAARAASAVRVRGPVYGLCLCAPTLGYAVALAYGGYLIARDDLNYEYAILVAEALIYGAWMLAEALSFAPNFAAARRAGGRILRALERSPAVRSEDSAREDPAWSCSGAVELSSVEFRYPSRPRAAVLRGLSLAVPRGRRVALVGASGCGKSTVLHLLMRSYDPLAGTLSLDGRDIRRSLPLPVLRRQLGLVSQEPSLFSRSLRDNIAYGDHSRVASMDEVIAAAQKANIHNFIAGLPLGYDTVLGSGGAALSGGQKQRVAIARALLRNPRVLLLDEATSALDANQEKTVQAALEAASEGRTTIIIAHRLATIRHVDTIYVLDKGVVAESGSHEELVAQRGLYWQLLQQQAATE